MSTPVQTLPELELLSLEEGIAYFDQQARQELAISGDEFIRRYQAGDLQGLDDVAASHLIVLLPFAGVYERDRSTR